ncbi:MAG: hypothetical protein QHH19_03310 [Candidatus Thermoplasmatota archaeon]|jgi:hypothetical protein|nr:hypothetical protein [Candidatus Thermoplasmatota archaeon]
MKLKILAICLLIMMLTGSIPITSKQINKDDIEKTTDDINEIRIAVYSMGDIFLEGMQDYLDIFYGYQWKVGNKIYGFNLTAVDDKAIFKGKLNTKNYEVFTISWMEASQMIMKLSQHRIKNFIWKNKVADFVKDGGGYFGSCAAATIMTSGLSNRPRTIYEKQMDRGSLHVSQVKSYINANFIFIPQLSGHPEKIGSTGYVWFSGWDENNESHYFSGCCLDVIVDKNNPIFSDLYENTRRIHWAGGPALIIPEQSNNVKVIAYYPNEEISDNKSTQIHAWKYTGRILGFIKGFIKTIKMEGNIFDKILFTLFKATDWKMTNKIIQTKCANMPFMTMEIYPNENQGRIILCGGHPEDWVWWGGHIEETKDTSKNNLFDALHYWTGIDKVINNYNWWIYRRVAAWAGKVPDNDLPPVYGPSQVCDIFPFNQTSIFTIYGNVEISKGDESLDLFYRHSYDNSSWSNWTLYGTDIDGSDGWSWEFNAPNGTGYYQFYSIRKVVYENYTEIEAVPPGPDAFVYIEQN